MTASPAPATAAGSTWYHSNVFRVPVPADLPQGQYRLYADIVHESGFTQTLVDTTDVVALPQNHVPMKADPDDSWLAGTPTAGGRLRAFVDTLSYGSVVVWNRPATIAVGAEMMERCSSTSTRWGTSRWERCRRSRCDRTPIRYSARSGGA